MEKQNNKPLKKKANSEIKIGTKAFKSFYLPKIRQAEKALKSKAAQIVVPLLKIQKKVSLKFDVFNKDYNDIIKKAETALKEINTHLEENKSDNMNLTDVQLNQKYANDHENMIKFYENTINKLDLFTRLINSGEYANIIQEFDKINNINENNIIDFLLSLANNGYEFKPKNFNPSFIKNHLLYKNTNIKNKYINQIMNNNIYLFNPINNNIINGNNIRDQKKDWICPFCNNLNFSFRTKCNRCKANKEESEKRKNFYMNL